jgi:hypothetical protein
VFLLQAWLKRCAAEAAASPSAAADWALLRAQAFPADARNAYAHLNSHDFSDAATRALPPEDNPFLQPRGAGGRRRGGGGDGEEMQLEEMQAMQAR